MAEGFRRVISHFSHPHPLKLITHDQQTLDLITTSPCSACKLNISSGILFYSCTICQDYFLHQSCFEMPKKTTHPFHKQHSLTLMPKTAYGNARFKCDACGESGNGFSYHCKTCSFDLHMLCAMLPLSVTHASHTMHNLKLCSESPYPNNKFSCDICMSIGSSQWLYRCKSCGFDAHLKCVAAGDDPVVPTPSQDPVVPTPLAPVVPTPSPSKDPVVPTPPYKDQVVPTPPSKDPVVPTPSAPPEPHTMQQQRKNSVTPRPLEVKRSQNNELTLMAVQQMIVNNSNALAQALLSGRVCGDNRGLHLLIECISALHNNTNSTGGEIDDSVQIAAGGGVSQDSLPAVMEGGGGGQDYMEAVTIGGGGCGSSLPGKINHPFDKKHDLTLLMEPAYGEGRFICDACRERGNGHCYHCQHCGIDLHVSCAMLPLSVRHDSHVCTLRLVFKSTDPNNKFSCDICRKPGSRQWLYRCKSCGFNAHLKCAAGDVIPPVHQVPSQPQGAAAWGRPPPPMVNSGFSMGQIPVNVPSFGVNKANTAMAQGLMKMISNSVVGDGSIPGVDDGGGQDYQQLLLGDGNGVGFLGALFAG